MTVLEVVVAPVDAAGTVGLAQARLGGVWAACGADPANERAKPLHLHLHVEVGLEKKVKAGDVVAFEGQAVGLSGAVGELDHHSGPVTRGLRGGWHGRSRHAESEQA